MDKVLAMAVENSALWAVYGDALGFISELVDETGLYRRIRGNRVYKTVAWPYFVGGRFGAKVELPAGCYSDDTQLRLATSRAIRGDGVFDVEAFAKVELTVWPSYALGGGRGTKLAASSLTRQDVNWFTNFFDQKRGRYIDCGGNGAAMRIQPHVWASMDRSNPDSFIMDVVKNAVCTHGHPRGILGAVFHALCLASALEGKSIPGPELWRDFANYFTAVPNLIRKDPDLGLFWLPAWEDRINTSIDKAFECVKDECLADIEVTLKFLEEKTEDSYRKMVAEIGGLKKATRGSGTKTAIIAVALSWMFKEQDPSSTLAKAANLLNSDTDTIATMAGAILGAVASDTPKDKLMDRDYIAHEASRLTKISTGMNSTSFSYPDLMLWQPPKTQLDAVGLVEDQLATGGLAMAHPISNEFFPRVKEKAVWQWLKLEFGQLILSKRRKNPPSLIKSNYPKKQLPYVDQLEQGIKSDEKKVDTPHQQQHYLFPQDSQQNQRAGKTELKQPLTIDELTREAINSNFNTSIIGRHLLEFARFPDGIEKGIAYSSTIIKAKMVRLQSKRNRK